MSRVNDAFLDYTHVWLLPHYFSPTWWELDNETLYQLPILHRCDNTEMFNVLNDMNLLFVSSLKYNVLPGSSEGDSREAYYLVSAVPMLVRKGIFLEVNMLVFMVFLIHRTLQWHEKVYRR